ncbi:phenylalanine--tRNA ligase subunit beta [Candidatus Micrarchaeota archaeon RBG_16_36_9]|nr:MAG: phenylalanine--tRNA ligase subunit beta [Candidatus Micrarchaeota archaeon RBG_16_36_9]
MVVIEISKNDLLNLLGKQLKDEEIEETLFLLKIETQFEGDKIQCELNPDRPDMFSVEGISREMRGSLGIETGIRKYNATGPEILLRKENAEVRPFIACGIIKDVVLSDYLIKSLMQIQEKLHATIGRNRKKVAIGVHDYDKMRPPLVYTDVDNERFVPLGMTEEMSTKEILEKHPKGIDYAHLLKDKYPLIYDKEGVISFPPIINSERTRITENTRNLFIDVTGNDEKAVNQVLNIMICNIAERCGKIFTVKTSNKVTPQLEARELTMGVEDIDRVLGIGLNESQITESLEKMRYDAKKMKGGKIIIGIPPYRSDIMHPIDIIEDVAIGYGYNNIEPILPKVATIGKESELEKLSRKIREVVIGLEFQEVLNFVLTSKENNFTKMNVEDEQVEILNPVSSEYNICRTWLLPGIMRIFSSNKHREYPQKIFEIGDCILVKDKEINQIRKLVCAISYDNANLTEIKSVVEAILSSLGYKYEIKSHNHPSFIESRCGKIIIDDKEVGFFGEIHPKILENWKLEKPVIVFEMGVE